MNVLIIEDEILAADRLEKLLHRHDAKIQVLAKIASVEEAEAWFSQHPEPDLLMSDIHLSDGLCFELFQRVNVTCPVIFTTSYDNYALEAFEVHSVAYLLKPIRFEKLVQSLQKLDQLKANMSPDWNPETLASQIMGQVPANYKQRFLVKNGQQIRVVKTDQIRYFYADQKLTMLMTEEGKRFPMDQSLDRLMPLLDPNLFFRVNRRFIIHLDAAAMIRPYFKGRLSLELNPPFAENVIISSERTPAFKRWLDQ